METTIPEAIMEMRTVMATLVQTTVISMVTKTLETKTEMSLVMPMKVTKMETSMEI